MIDWHEGSYDAADAIFDKALERSPDLAAALAGKGRVAMARGEWARAAELFDRSYRAHPLLETAWLLGDAREAAGDAQGAETARALVAKGAANDPRTYSLFLSARKDRTKEQYSEALRLASEVHVKRFDVHTEDALAWALYRAGMVDTAKTAMGRARRLHTPDARILFHEGAIRIAAGDVKKGKELVEKALATNRAFDWHGAKEARELLKK
jgi:tetratricopeptide (TPR) repeat protein